MTKANIKLSVIVPCYNEEKRFQKGFEHYYSYLAKQKYLWELIFVNDGSRDKTLQLMQKAAKGKSSVRILTHSPNRGKGYAIIHGIREAKGKYILFTDLDHSVPINTVEKFFDFFDKGYKVVFGSRRAKGAQILVHQHPLREFLGQGFTFLVRLLIDFKIRDATCGFKAFEKEAAKKIFAKLTVFDWAFDAEIIYICKKLGYRIAQAPVSWRDVRGTKVNLKRDVVKSLVGLAKIHANDLQGEYD